MTYVSFVEIFGKSVGGFEVSMVNEDMSEEEALEKANLAYIYATLSFFGGVFVMLVSLIGAYHSIVRCL